MRSPNETVYLRGHANYLSPSLQMSEVGNFRIVGHPSIERIVPKRALGKRQKEERRKKKLKATEHTNLDSRIFVQPGKGSPASPSVGMVTIHSVGLLY